MSQHTGSTARVWVRAYEGRLVRGEAADRVVVPMPESGDETQTPFEPAAYQPALPAFHRYRQRTRTGDHTGLVCLMDVAAFTDGRVRGHEQVLPERVEALVAHLATTPPRVELVTTIHEAGPLALAALADDGRAPVVDVVTADGVRHTVWPAAGDPGAEMSAARHYVADGHHRVAASLRLWERAGRPERFPLAVVAYPPDALDLGTHPGATLPAPNLAEILALADAGRTVAPKTTSFRPKPASGLFVRA